MDHYRSIAVAAGLLTLAGLGAAPAALAADAGPPLAGFAAIADDDLAELSGRDGSITLRAEQTFMIESGNHIAAGSVESGRIGLTGSFNNFRGFNNVTANTGNNANVQGGLNVIINTY